MCDGSFFKINDWNGFSSEMIDKTSEVSVINNETLGFRYSFETGFYCCAASIVAKLPFFLFKFH